MVRRWLGVGVAAALLGVGGGAAAWAQARRVWTARTTGLDAGVRAVAVDGAGNTYALGSVTQIGGAPERDYLVVKVGPTGTVLWTARYNGPGNDREIPFALAVSPMGGVVVTGMSRRGGTGEDAGALDIATVKFNGATGAQEWAARHPSSVAEASAVVALAVDAQGGVVVGGATRVGSGNTANDDFAVLKYSPQGALAWSRTYGGDANQNETVRGLALDGAGDVYVTGELAQAVPGGSFLNKFSTTKFAGATGATLWSDLYSPDSNAPALSRALAVDAARGRVFVTGGVLAPSLWDNATVQYDAQTGARIWARIYDSSSVGDSVQWGDFGEHLAVDPADGGVFVGGYALPAEGLTSQGLLIKYGASGALRWQKRGERVPTSAAALFGDGRGGVYSIGDFSAQSGAVWKFDSQTGAPLVQIAPVWAEGVSAYSGAALDADGALRVVQTVRDGDSDAAPDLQVSKFALYARAVDVSVAGLATDASHNALVTFSRADGKYEVWRVAPSGVVEAKTVRDAPVGGYAPFAVSPIGARDTLIGSRTGSSLYRVTAPQAGGPLTDLFSNTASDPYIPLGVAALASESVTAGWAQSEGGRFQTWRFNAHAATPASVSTFGPYANLAPFDISAGWGDEKTRLAWVNQASGAVTLWRLNGAGTAPEAGKVIASPSGYKLTDMNASGADNKIRLLWTRHDNAVAVWQLKADMSGIEWGKIYGPYAGARAVKITVGTGDNQTRVLWNYDTGKTALWTLGPTGAIVRGVLFPAF